MGLFNRNKQQSRAFFPEGSVSTIAPLTFTAEKNPTVAACVDKIANTFSSLTPILYAHTKHGDVRAVSNPVYGLLQRPAYEETRSLFWKTLVRHIVFEGNGYIYLSRNSRGEVINMSLCNPKLVRVSRDEAYRKVFTVDGKRYSDREILHIPYPGAGYNGTVGISPVELHRDLINLDNTLLEYVQNYFGNSVGSRLSIELGNSYPSRPADMDKLYASIMPIMNKFVIGARNAGKPMINLPDTKASVIDQPSNVQAELQSLMDMVEHHIAVACFCIPYENIDSKANKYNSLETKQNDYLEACIRPLGDHICQSLEKLLDPADTALYIAFDYKTLLATDTSTTVDYLIKEFNNGALTMNELRKKLGMESIGSVGDYHFVASNLMPLTEENIEAYMAKNKAELEASKHNPNGDDKN